MIDKNYMKRRFKCRCYQKDNTVKIYDGSEILFDVSYRDFDDAFYCSRKLKQVIEKLNELHEENQIKLEIIDAFIRGLEDEKGIVPEDREFQCRMNHTIKVLKELKRDMLNPTAFKRLKEVELDD